ncbi:MAG TPA: hypothetical protein VG900_15770 [Hyphomicrobiaceae bacterium]|jgi:hypothetical protein|nr:hypothetical protein [Hyphomicrobiaceae bacterium]
MKRAGNPATIHGKARQHSMVLAGPERLVGLGFRYWLAGYRTGDISCWERTWCAYSGVMGAGAARVAVGDLASWVRAINRHAERDLQTAATDCERFCRDECIAIAMIAACQHQVCPAMRACAFALLGCSMIEDVVKGAETFAASMRGAEQVLSPNLAHGMSFLAVPVANAALH